MSGKNNQETITIHLLGGTQILYRTSPLDESLARKERALLIYLVCQPEQRFSREHVATLLWGEIPESRARYNLRRALWNLRRALDEVGLSPEDCLAVEGSWIQVPSTAPYWVDVRVFEEVLQACFQGSQSRLSPASEGIRRIRRALDLYQGDFLAGFSVPNAPNFDEWLVFERERLFLLLLRALTRLIQDFIARGDRDEAVAACQRLLVLDPLQEDIHRLLMRLYWETGQRPQALRQYNTYRDLLQRELRIEPLEETQELYQRILQCEVAPATVSSSLVLTSRLTPPAPAPESLPRPRLFSLLDRGLAVRLTLLSAPPGYGKTTLLAQWLAYRTRNGEATQPLSLAWYKVDETDNAPPAFIEGLAASVARPQPDMGGLQDEVHDLLALQGGPRQAAGLVMRALGSLAPAPFVIVLDDLERLTSSDSQELLQYLVEHLPANGHLYLLTRVDPDLPLPRLRVRGQLLEIRASELCFTDEEMTAFLKQAHNLNLSPSEVAELATRAEGWVAPLWLAANALSRFTTSLDDVWDGLFAYIRDEVLAPQEPEVRAFLLRSAVLDRLTPTACQAVLNGSKDVSVGASAKWLVELERHNLFLRRLSPHTTPSVPCIAGGDGEPQYAYHPLFLAFLRAELPYHLSNSEIEDLHRRAAQVWEQGGSLEAALFHYQQVGDEAGIARLLERIAPAYLQQGRLEPLARWLDLLEPAVRDQHPRLTLNAGRLRQAEGRMEEAGRLYRRAADGFDSQQDVPSCGESLLALAELKLLRGRYAEGIELGWQAMDCWGEADSQRRATGLCLIGQLQACQGDLLGAETSLKQAKQLIAGYCHPLLAFQVQRVQAWVAYLRGAYHRAMGLNRLAEQEAGQEVAPAIVAAFHNPVPAILREWGEGDAAWQAAHQRLDAAQEIQDQLALAHAYTDLGNLYLDRNRLVEAEGAFRQALAAANAVSEDGLYRLYGEAHLVIVHLLRGHQTKAVAMADAALQRCQGRNAASLELALARLAVALAHVGSPQALGLHSGDSRRLLDEAYEAFEQMGVRYGVFVSAALLGLVDLAEESDASAGNGRQARRYVAKAMALAAGEGYAQTLVSGGRFMLPLVLFALREGIESRFVGQVLAQMGPQSLPAVVELAQDESPTVRGRVAAALEIIGAREEALWEEARPLALTTLEQLAQDSDAEVRDLAEHALRGIGR
jgi:LuxR family maltose regulon positive regulatory protein